MFIKTERFIIVPLFFVPSFLKIKKLNNKATGPYNISPDHVWAARDNSISKAPLKPPMKTFDYFFTTK
ncbi:hypothetical protein BpHYR1_051991 [Brachionus plicatilis]|uniref:Uncharacterized protein n=1 Tax=Brachionus plicatilis TaxID=10195 RepID=A0A3M7R7N4_BRAPC|nr:hypothetical protein BpHYR1_051991 [Brachionus plicatilis]